MVCPCTSGLAAQEHPASRDCAPAGECDAAKSRDATRVHDVTRILDSRKNLKKIEDVFGLRDKEQLVQCPGSGLLDISGVLTGADRTILAIGYGWLCDEIDWDDPG